VIGDAVNVAARVEAATRESGDSLLLTAETRERLRRALPLVPRGEVMLAGRDEPIEIYAPADGEIRPEATAPAVERA
jgi:adenylate cyclase